MSKNEERQAFANMSDNELTAYWRILCAPAVKVDSDGKLERHAKMVRQELTARHLPLTPSREPKVL